MALLAPTEIKALARIIGELDYYQLLHIEPRATAGEVKGAYYATSRSFHPDANRHRDEDLRVAVERIAKRVSEAYQVLRDPRRRRAYDEQLASGEGTRMQLAAATARAERKDLEEREGQTAQGRQYVRLALADMKAGNLESAMRNLQTAVTFEPGNANLKERLGEIRKQLGYKS